MTINKAIKKAFKEMCINEFPGRIYKLNLYDDDKEWCYVQAGNHFRDYIQYELIKYKDEEKNTEQCEIQFHIEFDKEQENEDFYNLLPKKIRKQLEEVEPTNDDTYCRWYRLSKTPQKITDALTKLEQLSKDFEAVTESDTCAEFCKKIKKLEEMEQYLYDAFLPMVNLLDLELENLVIEDTVMNLVHKYR